MTASAKRASLCGPAGRRSVARRLGAWLGVLALLAQTLAMLAPAAAAASIPTWPAGSLCLAGGTTPGANLPGSLPPYGKHGLASHDCQGCLLHHAAAPTIAPPAVVLARIPASGDRIAPPANAFSFQRHAPSAARPRAPPAA